MQRIYCCGFSLIEALVFVALLALIGTIAIPTFTSLIERNRATLLADQLQAHLTFARTSSVSQHRNIEVCGSSNGIDCDRAWQQGWIVRQVGVAEPLRMHRLTSRDRLRWNRSYSVVFQGNGTSPASNGHFYICNDKAEVVWSLVVNNQGRIKRIAGMNDSANGEGLCSSGQ